MLLCYFWTLYGLLAQKPGNDVFSQGQAASCTSDTGSGSCMYGSCRRDCRTDLSFRGVVESEHTVIPVIQGHLCVFKYDSSTNQYVPKYVQARPFHPKNELDSTQNTTCELDILRAWVTLLSSVQRRWRGWHRWRRTRSPAADGAAQRSLGRAGQQRCLVSGRAPRKLDPTVSDSEHCITTISGWSPCQALSCKLHSGLPCTMAQYDDPVSEFKTEVARTQRSCVLGTPMCHVQL